MELYLVASIGCTYIKVGHNVNFKLQCNWRDSLEATPGLCREKYTLHPARPCCAVIVCLQCVYTVMYCRYKNPCSVVSCNYIWSNACQTESRCVAFCLDNALVAKSKRCKKTAAENTQPHLINTHSVLRCAVVTINSQSKQLRFLWSTQQRLPTQHIIYWQLGTHVNDIVKNGLHSNVKWVNTDLTNVSWIYIISCRQPWAVAGRRFPLQQIFRYKPYSSL